MLPRIIIVLKFKRTFDFISATSCFAQRTASIVYSIHCFLYSIQFPPLILWSCEAILNHSASHSCSLIHLLFIACCLFDILFSGARFTLLHHLRIPQRITHRLAIPVSQSLFLYFAPKSFLIFSYFRLTVLLWCFGRVIYPLIVRRLVFNSVTSSTNYIWFLSKFSLVHICGTVSV